MKTKILLASSLCLLLVSWNAPANNHLALAVSIEKQGALAGQAAGTPNSDSFVSDQVRQAFINDNKFAREFNNITVDTKDGVVTLKGKVPDETTKAAFAQKASAVPGVKSVDNQLEINK
jgi:hyperosmotically inducible periplasmic protein